MKLKKLTDPTDKKIRKLHANAQRDAAKAVKAALQCGMLLIERRQKIEHGGWEDYLVKLGMSPDTALRYMTCARNYTLGDKQLDGKSLMDLYREYGLLPELAGGGQRKGKAESPSGQLFFDFNLFDGFMRVIDASQENPFLKSRPEELKATRERTAKALTLMDEALKPVIEAK